MIDRGYLLGERYQIIDTLGEGGMANVYLAKDIILQRKVAVKVLRLDLQKDPQLEARFQREAMATSELSHPNIVSVLDVGTDQGIPYMVMEYVDGPDLKEYIQKNSPLDLHEVIRIMDQILSAVALAHKYNVIHRDLKSQNILMDKRGNVKIADFGIAVALNQSSITQTNSVMGSVHYMSPEQTRGGLVTKQSDIYSLGIILYELITGHVPFSGETPVAIALKHAQEKIPSIRQKNEIIPQALKNVVLKATAKDPRDRYETVQAMKSDLDTSLDPSRQNEAAFVPAYGINNDETRILPGFKPKEDKEEEKPENDDKSKEKRSFWQSFMKHKWWFIFIGIASILIVFMMIFALNSKNTGQVRVPDVTNMTEGTAKAKIEDAGLRVGTVKRRQSDSIDVGKVVTSTPNPGDNVTKGQAINLIISSGAGMVKVPDLVGRQYSSAASKLEKMGFDVIREDQYSDKIAEGSVISQSIAAGVEVKPRQTTITLVVSQGPRKPKHRLIKLKDLKNMTVDEAKDYAKAHDLELQINEVNSNSVAKGLVISSDPNAGSKVEAGSTITIKVSKGPKEDKSDNQSDKDGSQVTKNFVVPFSKSDDESSDGANHVQIYIQDEDHSIGNIYRDMYISKDSHFSIPFNLKNGNGQLKVVRDGKTILNEKVTK